MAARIVADRKIEQRRDGSAEITYRVADVDELVRWVLGWGAQAEIVAPDAVRARIAALAKKSRRSTPNEPLGAAAGGHRHGYVSPLELRRPEDQAAQTADASAELTAIAKPVEARPQRVPTHSRTRLACLATWSESPTDAGQAV